MSRTCTVCLHRQGILIDDALKRGESLRGLAIQYPDLSRDALRRHKAHLQDEGQVVESATVVVADDDHQSRPSLVEHLQGPLMLELAAVRRRAIARKDDRLVLAAVKDEVALVKYLLERETRSSGSIADLLRAYVVARGYYGPPSWVVEKVLERIKTEFGIEEGG